MGKIRHRESILRAIQEYQRPGREGFLKRYGFGPARSYFLVHEGKRYDSKAIVGVAFGYENPSHSPLTREEFSGGYATVSKWLGELGFEDLSATR
jgi:5-methylcytosine-specific restriction protein A